MKKKVYLAVVTTAVLMLTACGASGANTANETDMSNSANIEETVNTADTANTANMPESVDATNTSDATDATDASTESNIDLPAYDYPGPEYFYHSVYQYIVQEYASQYEAADVSIPYVNEIEVDMSNRDDILMYGDFWIFNYNLEGDTLKCVSGGAYPGVIHLNADFDVVSMDVVEDGSNFTESAKKLFGDHYDKFMEVEADAEAREQIRAQIIANYVAANELPITKYQDEGWDPITLPEENIDSFYSELD
ncbi:MAG: hypothetical protein E7297_08100 [Lachnospiraceae bacterium]|nr:hypothetical protein [Lachnospiraceae bacterium]